MKTLFTYLTVLASSALLNVAQAQLLPIFNQYHDHIGIVNPAAVGTDFLLALGEHAHQMTKIGLGHRLQWATSEDWNVNTSILNASLSRELGNVGFSVGGHILRDQVDITSSTNFLGRGAVYVGNMVEGNFWGGVGFNAGYSSHVIDLRRLKAHEQGDPLLEYARLTDGVMDIGMGMFGTLKLAEHYNRFLSFGVSALQVNQDRVAFLPSQNSNRQAYDFEQLRHLYGHITFYSVLSSRRDNYSSIEFSIWAKHVDGLTVNTDFNLRFQISSVFWLGLGYNPNHTLHLQTGINIFPDGREAWASNRIRISYGIDYSFNSSISSYTGPSHELHAFFLAF